MQLLRFPGLKRLYWRAMSARWRLSPTRWRWHFAELGFDRRHGVDTTARVELARLAIDSENLEFGRVYAATPIALVRGVLSRLGIRHGDFSLVDLGSGKGRVLLLASEYGFRSIIGVEFSPELNAIALKNIRLYPGCAGADVRSICMDAAVFEFPREPCVVFLCRPFDEPVVEKVVANLRAALAGGAAHIIVVYFWPQERAPFERSSLFNTRESHADLVIYEAFGPPRTAA
ncbi:MAG: class I SAM-dependent methyltransferase [Burkholderiales bacterium]